MKHIAPTFETRHPLGFLHMPPHFLERFRELNWGLILLLIIWGGVGLLLLTASGHIEETSADSQKGGLSFLAEASERFSTWAHPQSMRMGLGFVVMMLVAVSSLKLWMKLAYPLYGLVLILLVLVEFKGVTLMGAKRWIDLGPFNLQPSEIIKPALVLALARYCHSLHADEIAKPWLLIAPLFLILLPAALVFRQPDLGTALLIAGAGFMVLFLAGLRTWKIMLGIGGGLAAAPVLWFYYLHDYQKNRVLTFLDPERDPLGAGYHILQSKIAFGSGGLTGRGFLQGTQSQYNFLPEKQTDFIFTLLGEEFGLFGTLGMLGLFMVIMILCTFYALVAYTQFARLLILGIAANFALMTIINVAMVTGLAPVVGVPLPLLSYGGTASLATLFGFGLVLLSMRERDVILER